MLFILWMNIFTLSAQKVTIDAAKEKAFLFINQSEQSHSSLSKVKRKDPILVLANDRDEFYVFNDEANGGYVIVSGDERTPDILAYSNNGHYDSQHIPCNMQVVLDGYAEQLAYLRANPNYKLTLTLTNEEPRIEPLLGETEWSQGWPYNNMCPTIDGSHCVTGCVATATAQLMYYNKWPESGKGSVSYEWNGQTLSADFSQSVYRWDLMKPIYDHNSSQESCDAVALLMRDIGYSCYMDYGLEGSGAQSSRGALIQNFDYDESMGLINRDYCDADSWHRLIMDDLINGQPIFYEGGGHNGAHALVLDGYDGAGYYHFNFGWGPGMNGYYTMLSIPYHASPIITFGLRKNEGGEPRFFFGAHNDFMYIPEKDAMESDLALLGLLMLMPERYSTALAVENVDTHEITYIDNGCWQVQFHLSETLPDGDYILYPVARINDDPWQKFMFNDGRQTFVDLNIKDGQKTYANNHIGNDIQEGAVEIDSIYYFLDDSNHEASVTYRNDRYASYNGDVTIPATIVHHGQEYNVTEIGTRAFDHSHIGDLRIANTIRIIRDAAFFGAQIDRILFEKESELKEIYGFAFQACEIKSGQLNLPEGLEYIPAYTFYNTYAPWISIPKTIKYQFKDVYLFTILRSLVVHWDTPLIPRGYPFAGCDLSLLTLYVPKGTIDMYSQTDTWKDFGHIAEMEDTITIDGLKYMLHDDDHSATLLSAFDMKQRTCSIPSVIIYQGQDYIVKQISPFSFVNSPIEELTIPSSVEYIGEGAFNRRYREIWDEEGITYGGVDYNLKKIRLFHPNPPKVADITEMGKVGFETLLYNGPNSNDFETVTLCVPPGSKTIYQSDSFWGQFTNIMEEDALQIDPLYSSFNEKDDIIYSINGIRMNSNNNNTQSKGIYIQKGKKFVK